MQERVCLIVPCFNEAKRLDVAQFEAATREHPLWFVFVDDGSTDATSDLIRSHLGDRLWLVALDHNCGKAEAVRQGMLRAASLPFYGRMDWLGFWDADLSTPLSELPRFLESRAGLAPEADAVFGSRVSRVGGHIRRRAGRYLLGRIFAAVATLLLDTQIGDPQCGAKILRKRLVAACFGRPFVSRWLFDLEILLRLGDATVIEHPLGVWNEVAGGQFRVLPNVWRTLIDLWRIRTTYGRRRASRSGPR
jgi:dolichyl-phosphate beta-glucosyltransferase